MCSHKKKKEICFKKVNSNDITPKKISDLKNSTRLELLCVDSFMHKLYLKINSASKNKSPNNWSCNIMWRYECMKNQHTLVTTDCEFTTNFETVSLFHPHKIKINQIRNMNLEFWYANHWNAFQKNTGISPPPRVPTTLLS